MLKFNLNVILAKQKIPYPRRFLLETVKINHVAATNLLKGSTKSLHLSYLSRLCVALQCTPNDLLEWIPDKSGVALPENHPLQKLANRAEEVKLVEKVLDKLGTMSADELRAMMETMAEKK